MSLQNPWALLLLPLVAGVAWRRLRRRPGYAFGELGAAIAAGHSWRQRWLWLPPALHALGLVALVIALARPQSEIDLVREEREGIAIELVLDVSSSMETRIDSKGGRVTQLDVAKKVLADFVLGNGTTLPGRAQDLMGLVTFARYADTVSPMTLNHRALAAMIEEVEMSPRPNEDGTAFGDALALAAARLQVLDELQSAAHRPPIKTKVIVLLTDGENNAGEHLPLQATAMAKSWGIRVYTIMLGMEARPLTAAEAAIAPPSPAEQILDRMAATTGGVFRHAYDLDSLNAVYKEINALEKSPVATVRYTDYTERFAWFALPALLLLALEQGLRFLFLRSIA